ncbi:MAG TPA: hypothetical protein VFQ85_15645 [Mycobacteriales bacterium]|jgi:hypothetical protein|nr:hypothetical protein [Mycobacteriales bacterium]
MATKPDFDAFVQAVRTFELDDATIEATAHTSAVQAEVMEQVRTRLETPSA